MKDEREDNDDCTSYSSGGSSVPFENVDEEVLKELCADTADTVIFTDDEEEGDRLSEMERRDGDTFPEPSELMTSKLGAPPPVKRMHQKDYLKQSFRDRKKQEMRHKSFTYKQVSDNATPTAHRKQKFSNRSACKLTELVEEEMAAGKHLRINDYHFLKTLGKGAYGEVRLATKDLVEHDLSQHTRLYAIKVMQRSMFEDRKQLAYRGRRHTSDDAVKSSGNLNQDGSGPLEDDNIPSALLQEINIMKRLAHPNLVKLKEIINDDSSKYLFLVLEFMQGGTVMMHDPKTNTYVYAFTKKVMLEGTARRVFRELTSALSYLHANHIAHRDIKPDNLLIDMNGTLKLSDFGVSTHFINDRQKRSISMKSLARSTSRGQMQQTEGTYSFYSPEMCSTGGRDRMRGRGYNAYMADLWAAGICLWIFVFGTVPFESNDVTELFRKIREEEVDRPHRLSPELDNLLSLMMRKNVTRRPSVMDVRHHCWITEQPLSQHGEVFVSELDAAITSKLSTSLTPTTSTLTIPTPSHASSTSDSRQSLSVVVPKEANQVISPRINLKLVAWAARARSTCADRHNDILLKGQAEINAVIRKAIQKSKELGKDAGSGDSSDFSLGGSDSSSEEGSVVSFSENEATTNELKTVFGSFYGFNDEELEFGTAAKRHSSPTTRKERNIFQRGIHKIGKRMNELQRKDKTPPKSAGKSRLSTVRESTTSTEDTDSPRAKKKSLVERGLHKVVKRISKSGPNTDKHLYEDSGSPKVQGNEDSKANGVEKSDESEDEEELFQKASAMNIKGWLMRNKTT